MNVAAMSIIFSGAIIGIVSAISGMQKKNDGKKE